MNLSSVSLFCGAVAVLLALSSRGITAEKAVSLPHSSCESDNDGNETVVVCITGNYSLPGNFDFNLFPAETSIILLGTTATGATPISSVASTVHDTAKLPASLTALYWLELFTFQGANGARFPFETFLSNVRGTLRIIHLRSCRIQNLGADFLKGFRQLRRLELWGNDISDISISAFETRIGLPEESLPVLDYVSLSLNLISSLDWAVFSPLAHSIQELKLSNQNVRGSGLQIGMSTLTLTKPFNFTALTRLDMSRNSLNFLPRDILSTLLLNTSVRINLEWNFVCRSDPLRTCGCCTAQEFVQWAHETASGATEQRAEVTFTCGKGINEPLWNTSATDSSGAPALPPRTQFSCCVNSQVENCVTSQPDPPTTTTTNPNGSPASEAYSTFALGFAAFSAMFVYMQV